MFSSQRMWLAAVFCCGFWGIAGSAVQAQQNFYWENTGAYPESGAIESSLGSVEPVCDSCNQGNCRNCEHNLPKVKLPGFKGQPYRSQPLGGCPCGKRSKWTNYNFHAHWHSPFSVILDHGVHGKEWRPSADTTQPRLRDCLDIFANVKLLPDVRCDNGYEGPHCDPYGHLGASRQGRVLNESAPATIPGNSSYPLHSGNVTR